MATYDLTLRKGVTEKLIVNYKDSNNQAINLSGYLVRSQGRLSMEDSDTLFSLSVGNGIAVVAVDGAITITWTAVSTAAMTRLDGGVWSLEIQAPDGTVTELLGGNLTIAERATRG